MSEPGNDYEQMFQARVMWQGRAQSLEKQLGNEQALVQITEQQRDAAIARAEAAEAEAAALRTALEKFGRHVDGCQGWGGHRPTPNSEWIPNKCTCGLSAALEPRK
jgi:hypothetical protein